MRLAAAGVALLAFLAVSALVGRVIAAGSSARSEAVAAIKREARTADVRILRVDGVGGFAPAGRTETGRIAWKAGTRLPVVQCVRVRRTGDPIGGYDVAALSVSRPIAREADCP